MPYMPLKADGIETEPPGHVCTLGFHICPHMLLHVSPACE
jgi:hypothetical protein